MTGNPKLVPVADEAGVMIEGEFLDIHVDGDVIVDVAANEIRCERLVIGELIGESS